MYNTVIRLIIFINCKEFINKLIYNFVPTANCITYYLLEFRQSKSFITVFTILIVKQKQENQQQKPKSC